MAERLAVLIMRVEVAVDPTLDDPHEIANYVIDDRADDPVPSLLTAEWED